MRPGVGRQRESEPVPGVAVARDPRLLPGSRHADGTPVEEVEARDASRGVSEGELGGGRQVRAQSIDGQRRAFGRAGEATPSASHETARPARTGERSSRETPHRSKRRPGASDQDSASPRDRATVGKPRRHAEIDSARASSTAKTGRSDCSSARRSLARDLPLRPGAIRPFPRPPPSARQAGREDAAEGAHAQRAPDGPEERHEARRDAPAMLFDDVLDREHLRERRRAEARADQAARGADRERRARRAVPPRAAPTKPARIRRAPARAVLRKPKRTMTAPRSPPRAPRRGRAA